VPASWPTDGALVARPGVGELVARKAVLLDALPLPLPLLPRAREGACVGAIDGRCVAALLGALEGRACLVGARVETGRLMEKELEVGCLVGKGDGTPGAVPQKHPFPQVCERKGVSEDD